MSFDQANDIEGRQAKHFRSEKKLKPSIMEKSRPMATYGALNLSGN